MIKSLKSIFSSLMPSKTDKTQNFLFCVCAFLFFAYCFSIPALSCRYPFNYVSIAICALMCIGMILYAFFYETIRINILIGVLILFNLTMVVSHLLNGTILSLPKTIILVTIVAFCLYQFISPYSKKSIFIYIIFFAGLTFAVVYIVHYYKELIDLKHIFDSRLGGFFDNENEISKEFGFFCVASLALGIKNKKILFKVLLYIAAFIFLFLILSTGSISNLLTITMVCILVAVLCQPTTKRKIIVGAVALSLIVLFIVLVQLPFMSYFKTRIDNIFSTLFDKSSKKYDGSTQDRLQAAITSIRIALNKIVFGFGYMSATRFTPYNIQAHNNLAELLIDFGIVGLFLYELLVVLPIWKGFNRYEHPYVVALMLYMLMFQFFLTTYYKKFEYIFFACIYALIDDEFKFKYLLWDSSKLRELSGKTVIFEVIPSLNPIGGAEMFLASFASTIKEKYNAQIDIKVVCLYNQTDSELLKKLKSKNIEVFELDKQNGLDILCACRFRELVFKYNPDIIHTHLYSLTTLKIALPFRRKSIKLFHTIHHNLSKTGKGQKLLKSLVKTNYLTPICVSKSPSEEFSEWFGKETKYVSNGIELDHFDDTQILKNRRYDFLCVARFAPIKNQKYLINLYKNSAELRKYSLVFLGDGTTLDECKEFVKNNNLEECISFVGKVDNVNEYMSNSKVLLIPSYNEGNPLVIIEAFASGMAAVGNDVGGIHDLLSGVEIGGLAKISNPKQFENKMLSTLENTNNLSNKIKYDRNRFDMNTTVDKYLKLFGVID